MAAPTDPQTEYVNALCKRLRLPLSVLDTHCRGRFGKPFCELGRREVSNLIDELRGWQEVPADLRVAQGQLVMAGMGL